MAGALEEALKRGWTPAACSVNMSNASPCGSRVVQPQPQPQPQSGLPVPRGPLLPTAPSWCAAGTTGTSGRSHRALQTRPRRRALRRARAARLLRLSLSRGRCCRSTPTPRSPAAALRTGAGSYRTPWSDCPCEATGRWARRCTAQRWVTNSRRALSGGKTALLLRQLRWGGPGLTAGRLRALVNHTCALNAPSPPCRS